MRGVLAALAAVGMSLGVAGCPQVQGQGGPVVTSGPVGFKSKFADMSREEVLRSAAPGDSLAEITRHVQKDSRDSDRTSSGLRWFFFYSSSFSLAGGNDRYHILCFKGDKMVGRNRGMCEHVATQLNDRQAVEDELSYMREYHRNRSPRIDLARLPPADPSSAGFVLGGIRWGAALSSVMPPCPVDPAYREQEAKNLGRLCTLDILPGESVEAFQVGDFGVSGQTFIDVRDGFVDRVAFLSKRYDSKNFSRDVKEALVARYGPPAFYDEMQVGDSRGRFNLKFVAYWRIAGSLVYLTNYGYLSERAMLIVGS